MGAASPVRSGRALLMAVLLLAAPSSTRAALSDNLQGFLDVTGVQAEVDGATRNSLRQLYTVHWSKQIVPYVKARASFRYLRLDLGNEDTPNVLNEEWQPSGEILWKHPQFSFVTTARRRNLQVSTVPGRQVGDNVAVTLSTHGVERPRLLLRYDWNHVFNRESTRDLDTKDERARAQVDYTLRGHALTYSFTRREAENVVSGGRGTENTQVFRWASPILRPGRRLTLSSNYTYTHRRQTEEQVDGGRVLTLLPGVAGLYAEDPSPELGGLASMPSLTDLNTQDPAAPPIDIGGALIYRNLGLDLGFERGVTILYVYTDRLSGVQPTWDVFVSRDNFEWDLWESGPAVEFNPDSNRYEIRFPTVSTRYVKVVNGGGNEEPEVFVTELEALVESDEEGKLSRSGGGHLVDVGADYEFTERVSSSLDASYESVPFFGIGGQRRRGDYALGGKYRMSRIVLHTVRWQQGFQSFGAPTVKEKTSAASYTLLVEPLETLRFTTSLDARLDQRDGAKTDEFRGAVFRIYGTPVRRANLSGDVTRSRTRRHDVGGVRDTWNFRISGDGAVTRSLNGILSYSYQRVTTRPGDELRIRHRYGVSFDWRMTRTVFSRGTYNLIRDITDERSQDYLLSWNVAPKLTVSGQAFFITTLGDKKTERYNANLTYNLTARSTLYSSYTFADFRQVGGVETTSFQLGLRAGF